MSLQRLRDLLSDAPPIAPAPNRDHESLIADAIAYLGSEEAAQSLQANAYWPKWNSPWWQMALLYEMGAADIIPKTAVAGMTKAIQAQLAPFFFSEDAPSGLDPALNLPCHCQLGNIYQILAACGVDMDQALPWARPWFLRYQMPDGGLNCDESAYRSSPPASSIVGTIAPLEAVLYFARRPLTAEEEQFLDRGAHCLLARQLRHGCSVEHNAEERLDEEKWLKPCFPRFYLYDVLRGLRFVLRWSEALKRPLPADAIVEVVAHLCKVSSDGTVRIGRLSYEGVGTRERNPSGEWVRAERASRFPLLDEVSSIGQVSPYLTVECGESLSLLRRVLRDGLVR